MLTPKQQAFCREYLIDLNGTQAAIRAGYSKRTANEQAARLLAKVSVSSYMKTLMDKRAERAQVDADWVLKRLLQDATADVADLYDENGHLLPVKDWPMAWRTGLVAGVEVVQERDGHDADGKPEYVTVRKVRLSDRTKLLELLGKHIDIGAFKDKVEHSGKIGLESLITGDDPN